MTPRLDRHLFIARLHGRLSDEDYSIKQAAQAGEILADGCGILGAGCRRVRDVEWAFFKQNGHLDLDAGQISRLDAMVEEIYAAIARATRRQSRPGRLVQP